MVSKTEINILHFFDKCDSGPPSLPPSAAIPMLKVKEKVKGTSVKRSISDMLQFQQESNKMLESLDTWKCYSCTFENHTDLTICEICETARR